MARHNISFSEPTNEWLKQQVDQIRAKLDKAEKSDFTSDSKAQILAESKSRLNGS